MSLPILQVCILSAATLTILIVIFAPIHVNRITIKNKLLFCCIVPFFIKNNTHNNNEIYVVRMNFSKQNEKW